MRRELLLVALGASLFSAPSWSQTSEAIAAANPSATYNFIKRAMVQMGSPPEIGIRKRDEFTTLSSCDDSTTFLGYDGKRNSIITRVGELAYDVLYMQGELGTTRYPPNLWKSDVEAYEQSMLQRIKSFELDPLHAGPEKRRLAEKLNNYRQQHPHSGLQRIMADPEGCGAAEVQVRILTTPQAQRIQYINSIKYNLCSSQGLDPRGDACSHWVDYGAGKEGALMSGRYKVRASWGDGMMVYRDLSVDDLSESKDGSYTFAIRR